MDRQCRTTWQTEAGLLDAFKLFHISIIGYIYRSHLQNRWRAPYADITKSKTALQRFGTTSQVSSRVWTIFISILHHNISNISLPGFAETLIHITKTFVLYPDIMSPESFSTVKSIPNPCGTVSLDLNNRVP